MRALTPEFEFAGFTFPRYLATLPKGSFADRIAQRRNPVTGPYRHAPKPNSAAGVGFYLESDGMPDMRWAWCDEVDGARIEHTGWFTDEFGDGDTIRGIVFRLPHARGFLAGWSMGKNMASTLDCHVWSDEVDAARDADRMAQRAAEDERDYQAAQRAADEEGDEE